MIETSALKKIRGLTEKSQCRFCKEHQETVQHLLVGCKMLTSSEYLARNTQHVDSRR